MIRFVCKASPHRLREIHLIIYLPLVRILSTRSVLVMKIVIITMRVITMALTIIHSIVITCYNNNNDDDTMTITMMTMTIAMMIIEIIETLDISGDTCRPTKLREDNKLRTLLCRRQKRISHHHCFTLLFYFLVTLCQLLTSE